MCYLFLRTKLKTRRNVVFKLALFWCMWSLAWCHLVCTKLEAYIFLYLHSLSTMRFDASWCWFLFCVFWFSMLCDMCSDWIFFMNFVYVWMLPMCWGNPVCINIQCMGDFLTWSLGLKMECHLISEQIRDTYYFCSLSHCIKKTRKVTQFWNCCIS